MAEEAHNEEAQDSAETTEETTEETVEVPEDFDPKRAMRTIAAQRDSEEKAIARAKAAEAELASIREAEAEEARSLEEKLAAREARIAELETQAAEKDVRTDFITEATAAGIADPKLAYIAAKEEGLLGAYDPKTGDVGDHDFEELGNKFPSFAGEAKEQDTGFGGDAGKRGGRTKRTTSGQFNDAVRGSIRGL